MARKIIWSDEAVADLEAIAEYIERDSLTYATVIAQEIWDAGNSLNQFPLRGRIVPEAGKSSFRELIIRNYRLIYFVEKSRVTILAIVHGARDLNGKF